MRIVKPGEKLSKKELRYFAKMAGEAYVNDPVHSYATKDPEQRKKFVYHFMMERLNTSNGEDYFYIDDENRGICVWRRAWNEYTALDFLKCPDWLYLYIFFPRTLRTLAAYKPLDVKVFDENCVLPVNAALNQEHLARVRRAGALGQGHRHRAVAEEYGGPLQTRLYLRFRSAGRKERGVL